MAQNCELWFVWGMFAELAGNAWFGSLA